MTLHSGQLILLVSLFLTVAVGIFVLLFGLVTFKKYDRNAQRIKIDKFGVNLEIMPAFGVLIIGIVLIGGGIYGVMNRINDIEQAENTKLKGKIKILNEKTVSDSQVKTIVEAIKKEKYTYILNLNALDENEIKKLKEYNKNNELICTVLKEDPVATKDIPQVINEINFDINPRKPKIVLDCLKCGDSFTITLSVDNEEYKYKFKSKELKIPVSEVKLTKEDV